jgi:hypothetical protein
MKRNAAFTIAGLLAFFLLCLVPSGEVQGGAAPASTMTIGSENGFD